MNYKIRESLQDKKIPYVCVIGDKEIGANAVAVRKRGVGQVGTVSVDEFIANIEKEIKDKPDFYEGYTRNYIKVIVHCMSADITGKIVDVKLEEAVEDYAIASMV